MACVMNAANEVVVHAFLQNQIGFLSMSDIIEEVIQKVSFINTPTLQEYIASDAQAREQAQELIKTNSYKH